MAARPAGRALRAHARGKPMPARRTLAFGILPSARSMETSLRHPGCARFPTPPRLAWAYPSQACGGLDGTPGPARRRCDRSPPAPIRPNCPHDHGHPREPPQPTVRRRSEWQAASPLLAQGGFYSHDHGHPRERARDQPFRRRNTGRTRRGAAGAASEPLPALASTSARFRSRRR